MIIRNATYYASHKTDYYYTHNNIRLAINKNIIYVHKNGFLLFAMLDTEIFYINSVTETNAEFTYKYKNTVIQFSKRLWCKRGNTLYSNIGSVFKIPQTRYMKIELY